MYSYCYVYTVYSYCLYALFCIFCFQRPNWHSPTTLTEVFPCFFLSCKANARVYLAKTGHGPHSSKLVNCGVLCIVCVDCVVLCTVLRKCVLYYCHRVATQLQLNISSSQTQCQMQKTVKSRLETSCVMSQEGFGRKWPLLVLRRRTYTVIDIYTVISKVFEGDGHNPRVIHLISSVVLYGCSLCICDVHCTD